MSVGKPFDDLRKTIKNENIDELLKKILFGNFLVLPEDHTACFQISLVYGLLKNRIKVFHSDNLEMQSYRRTSHQRNTQKKSKESRTIKPPPSNRRKALSQIPPTKTNKRKEKIDRLLDIAGHRYKSNKLIKHLKGKTISKKYKEQLCLFWFAHSVILARDINKFIQDDLLKVVHPWVLPTKQKLGITSFITLGLVDIIADLIVELIKKELAGATSIRRSVRQGQVRPNVKALHDQPTVTNLGASFMGIAGGVDDVSGKHADADTTTSHDDEHLAYQEAYDIVDRIMDLNFYKNFKDKYDDLTKLTSTLSGPRFDSLVSGSNGMKK
ncbi:hypothetical protein FXO38_23072 [Capsicum annuum]|nr:hypothetical protein FXO38_23072 [Capsicum annuum]